jgi:hypothetical protein
MLFSGSPSIEVDVGSQMGCRRRRRGRGRGEMESGTAWDGDGDEDDAALLADATAKWSRRVDG